MGIPMLRIIQSWDCLILNMGIPVLIRHIEMVHWSPFLCKDCLSMYGTPIDKIRLLWGNLIFTWEYLYRSDTVFTWGMAPDYKPQLQVCLYSLQTCKCQRNGSVADQFCCLFRDCLVFHRQCQGLSGNWILGYERGNLQNIHNKGRFYW